MQISRQKGLLYTLLSIIVIAGGTFLAINYAKGNYRLTDDGFSISTGLLSVSSLPTGAQVFINDRLVTATDDTVYLEPNQYKVKIIKDGYSAWEKTLTLEPELVTSTNAKLFPSAPSITPLTFTGVENLSTSPDGQKILYYTASSSAYKNNGLYMLDLTENTLSFQKGPRQITENSTKVNLKNAQFIWSPDSLELILIDEERQLLIDTTKKNDLDSLPDITFKSKQLLKEWEQEMLLREQQFLAKFPSQIVAIATQSANNVYFSPDKKRLLYTASQSASIPDNLIPKVPAASSQEQERKIEVGGIYVYDREEDRNFRLGTASQSAQTPTKQLLTVELEKNNLLTNGAATSSAIHSLQSTDIQTTIDNFNVYHTSLYSDTFQWHPDSRHLFFTSDNEIKVVEYDGTNVDTLYSGPFTKKFAYPWPNGSRLLVLTSFSPNVPLNLYAIELE